MQKPAETRFPVLEPVRDRWSPRAFADRAVEPAKVGALLEAARWAASAFNEQPWRFVVATREDPELYARALSCLVEFNQSWAQAAPVLVLTAVSTRFAHNDKDNRTAQHDLGLAIGNLSVQATALGLVLHQMAGIDLERTRAEFAIPAGFEPVTGIAIGYPGDVASLSEQLQERERAPRERKALEELAFGATWGEPAPVLRRGG